MARKNKRRNETNIENITTYVMKETNIKYETKSKNEGIQELFERRTGYLMSDYIAEHLSKALNKYGIELFKKALNITLDRNEVKKFETPADFIKYMYGVCRNLTITNTWEAIK